MSRSAWKPETVAKRLHRPSNGIGPGDPARGEPVRRCRTCGMPRSVVDIVGSRGGVPGTYPVCNRCWFEMNPPDMAGTT